MEKIRGFINESIELIKQKALYNQVNGNFYVSLCTYLLSLESMANEYLKNDDSLFKEIEDLKKVICK